MSLEMHAPKVVPANVRVNLLCKSQPQQWKRPIRKGRFTYDHPKNIAAKETLLWEFKAMYPRFKPIAEPRRIGVQMYFETYDNNRDADNFAKLPLDAFTGIIWADDRQIKELYVRVHVDPKGSGCFQFVVYLLED